MKRFVSYLYSIYNNQKIHNAGFARIEIRTGRNRIEIHLKDVGYAGKTGTVYLFVRNENNIQGISIGNITFRGNQADLRYEQPDEIIGQTSWTIMQMNGIIVTIDEKVAFLSQWDEIPVDTEKFEIWEQPDEDNRGIKIEQQQSSQENEGLEKNTQGNVGLSRNTQENQNTARDNKKQNQTSINTAQRGQKQGSPDKAAQNQKESQMKGVNQGQENNQVNGSNQNQEIAQINGNNQNQGTTQINESNQNQKTTPTNERNQIRGANQINERNQNKNNQSQANTAEGNQKTSPEQLEQCEQTSSPSVQTAELQPQLQPGSQGWEQTWRYMLRAFPVIRQFDEKDDVLCIRIEIKDVRLLPDKYWSIVNNSFLLHGFFNYRYLAFGRIGQNWFIGVPGVYQNQEHAMASIFGFPDFLAQQKKNERGEQPGYWYRILELNQL